MMRRAVRLALLVLFLAAMGVTAYLFWMADRQAQLTTFAARTFDAAAQGTLLDVTDLKAAQQAYVAAGQGDDFWFARTAAMLTELKRRVTSLKSDAPASAAAFDTALSVLQDFERMDARAREYTRAHQMTLASDLIFSDGLDLTRKVADAIEQGRIAQMSASDALVASLHRRQLFSLGAAAAAATLIVLLLVPIRREIQEVPVAVAAPLSLVTSVGDRDDIGLGRMLDAHQDEGWSAPRVGHPVEALPAPPAQTSPTASVPELRAVDLQGIAAICADLARVADTQALPSILERAAQLLNAGGIVLWIADPEGQELAPIIAHGYPPNLLSRLGTLNRDAENATAAAFRTSLLQTVRSDTLSNGAIAAPLVSAGGCVGVMAAEVRGEGERQPAIVSAAAIIAAQLASLVGPPATRKAEAAV
jgi:GAF domain-containing protein